MTLKETLDFVDVGNKSINLSSMNGKDYYYIDRDEFERDEECEKLLASEVLSVDADGGHNTVIFYLY